jgi:hypothetical protein
MSATATLDAPAPSKGACGICGGRRYLSMSTGNTVHGGGTQTRFYACVSDDPSAPTPETASPPSPVLPPCNLCKGTRYISESLTAQAGCHTQQRQCYECGSTGFGNPVVVQATPVVSPPKPRPPLADPSDPTGQQLAVPDVLPELPYELILVEYGHSGSGTFRPKKNYLMGPKYYEMATEQELAFYLVVKWYER